MKPLLEIAERALDQLERWQDLEDWLTASKRQFKPKTRPADHHVG